MRRNSTQDRTDGSKSATRREDARPRELSAHDQADLDAFRAMQPLSRRALAKGLERMIRRK